MRLSLFCKRLVVVVLGLSLAARAGSSKYHDPFDPSTSPAAQSVTGRATAGPSLRVVLEGASAASMKELADFSTSLARWMNPAKAIDQVNPQHFQDELNQILTPRFRSIEYVYANGQGSSPAADYILTLEIAVKLGKHSFAENHVDLRGVLATPAGGPSEIFEGHGKTKIGYPAFNSHFAEAREKAFEEFGRSLSGSNLLTAYKAPGPAPSVAATAPPPAPSPVAIAPSSKPENTEPAVRGGLYDVESKITFNVLDSVYYDPASGELALIGHHDERFKDTGIPYLQHLATLLENPRPKFTLTWTSDSNRRVDSLLARELTQRESDEQAARLGVWVDSSGQINRTGKLMLPALGVFPIKDNRAPGDLGVEVQTAGGGRVVVMKIKPGSAADKAGLQLIDFIVSVRPDRPVFFASEFQKQVRVAGAGFEIEVTYLRSGQMKTAKVTLDTAADGDPWRQLDRYDLMGMWYRGAGDPAAAEVIESMGIMTRMLAQNEQKAFPEVYRQLMRSLGMEADFDHLRAVDTPSYNDAYNLGLKFSTQLDSIFHFSGNPLENSYKSTVQRSHDPGGALSQVLNEFEQPLKPKIGELIDRLILRPGVGFQIPPELVEEEYHIHPEMTPEYLGVPPNSQLARVMLDSDYLGKQLVNRQDLRAKIPGYQTQVEYQVNHPDPNRKASSAYRMWISIAGINAAQSKDGRVLAVRDAKMRFNVRQTDNQENDLPNQQPDGYADLLTGLYDQFEREFAPLHELREVAKLAAVAVWMQKQNAAIRLPSKGRAAWKGPEKVDGLVYIYLTVNQRHESKIFKMAEGGVDGNPYPNGNAFFPVDSSVVDLRTNPATAKIFTRPESSIKVSASSGSSSYVAVWVANGADGQQAVVLGTSASEANLTAGDRRSGVVGTETDARRQLKAIQTIDSKLNQANADPGSAQLGFDTGARDAGGVNTSGIPSPTAAPEELKIPKSLLNDKDVLALKDYQQQAQKLHQTADAAKAKFEDEQKKNPQSDQLPVLQVQMREAQDQAHNMDNMVKVKTEEVKKKIKYAPIDTGDDPATPPKPENTTQPPAPPKTGDNSAPPQY